MDKIEVIGLLNEDGYELHNRVYNQDGLSPTIRTFQGGGIVPKFIEVKKEPICLNSKGGRNGVEGLQPSIQDRVYATNGCSFAITTSYQPSIMESKIVAQRGRKLDGENYGQKFEYRDDNLSNTITSVQKDNLVMEKKTVKVRQATKGGSGVRCPRRCRPKLCI